MYALDRYTLGLHGQIWDTVNLCHVSGSNWRDVESYNRAQRINEMRFGAPGLNNKPKPRIKYAGFRPTSIGY